MNGMAELPAVLIALQVYKQPGLARKLSQRPIPVDLLEVIKIAANDDEMTTRWCKIQHCDEEQIRQACLFYLRHTLFDARDDKIRTLGLSVTATAEDLRIHKRWLLKWLHPDRNPNQWEIGLFQRVNASAHALELDWRAGSRSAAVHKIALQRKPIKSKRSILVWQRQDNHGTADLLGVLRQSLKRISIGWLIVVGSLLALGALFDILGFGF